MNDNIIKMFIGGEEVVSNKEFTINEEMLSASSTILNNCYPASWEETKDYVSNFYYPKDYSKYILGKGNFTYGTDQYSILSVSGETFMQFTTNVEKEWNSLNIYGKSTQATRSGKNLLLNNAKTQTVNGITFTINNDKSITITGTETIGWTSIRVTNNFELEPGTYVLKSFNDMPGGSYLTLYNNGTGKIIDSCDSAKNKFEFTLLEKTNIYIYLGVGSNTYNNTIFPMLVTKENDNSPYEQYGVSPSPNYPSEIESVGYDNLWNERWENGYYNRTTGAKGSGSNYIRCADYIPITPNTSIYFNKPSDFVNYAVLFYDNSFKKIGDITATNTTSMTFTSPSNASYFTFYGDTGVSNAIYQNNIIITKGAQPHPYIPYGKYGIEVETTNGTDTNTSLFVLDQPLRSLPNGVKDIAYIKNNILYVDRKVGSVVLDGSDDENWSKTGDTVISGFIIDLTDEVKNYGSSGNGLSNYFIYKYKNAIGNFYFSTSNRLALCMETTYNLKTFKTWLSEHNTQVDYELAEPYTETIGEVETLSTFKGVNNVSLDANMETNMNLTYLWKNYDVLFAGIVKNSGDISLRPTNPKYCSLQILDYKTFLSESDTLDFVISDKTIAEAISMVVDAISGYGFILGTINISQADDVIGAYSTLNKTAYDVFQYLANISGSRWRARFVDNDTMAIDFYDPELLPRANDIDYTQQYWEDNKIVDLTFNYGTRDYRNKQIILSDEVYGGIDYTEVLLSNGYGTSYITQNNIANITSITVNGVKAEVITQSEKDLGVDADFYYTPGKNVVESTTSYSAGTQIIITYTPLVKGRQIVYNDEEVTRIATQTNTTGVISRYENRNDILSSDELENIAETYIKYKGKPEIILKLTTLNNDLFNIGEICYFNSPIADLAQDYMVKSKATNYTSVAGETNIFYTYELTSSFNSEKAINYFDNQRNKTTGNIAEGESITRNIDINNSATIIWENATITEISVSVDGDNALNSVLNSPFIQ